MADDRDARGILLREFLDAEIRGHSFDDYDVFECAEAFFKKSEEQEHDRIADFHEWIQDIVRQPHPEIDFEDAPTEPVTQPLVQAQQSETKVELTTDLDQLSEADMDAGETHDQKEKEENAERSL